MVGQEGEEGDVCMVCDGKGGHEVNNASWEEEKEQELIGRGRCVP